MKEIRFIENASEITAGTRGASLGVDAMRVAANKINNTFFKEVQIDKIQDENHLLMEPIKFPKAIRAEGLSLIFDRIAEAVKSSLGKNEFPFVLAADHGSAGGTIAGIKAAFPDKKLGVVWIDAHADLHSPFTTPTGNMHGMPLATAISDDNKECQINDLGEEEIKIWTGLQNKYGINPKIESDNLFFIAVRDTEEPEDKLIERRGIRNFPVSEVNEKGVQKVVSEIMEGLTDCDILYVSFDVDSMDSAISKGTGTPVPNGLSAQQAKDFMLAFSNESKLICMEMVEINPTLDDKGNVMAETAFNILVDTTNELKKNLN